MYAYVCIYIFLNLKIIFIGTCQVQLTIKKKKKTLSFHD